MSKTVTRAGLIERAIVCGLQNRPIQARQVNITLMQAIIHELEPKAQSRAADTIRNLESQLSTQEAA